MKISSRPMLKQFYSEKYDFLDTEYYGKDNESKTEKTRVRIADSKKNGGVNK